MKKLLAMLFVAAMPLASFVSCSSSDDNKTSLADAVKGTYECSLYVTENGVPSDDAEDATVILTKKGGSVVDVELKNFSFNGMPVQLGEVKGINLSGNENAVIMNQTVTTTVILNDNGNPLGCSIKIVGSIKDKKDIELDLNIDVEGGIIVEVGLEGEKKK